MTKMWNEGWRNQIWSTLDTQWDMIIIGGGITGAGILREATLAGLKTLLLEAHDFSSGTSSRSSKLVHGGFRYLRNGQIKLTYESVRERERLLKHGPGLILPIDFLIANYKRDSIPGWVFGAALTAYDILAYRWNHKHYSSLEMLTQCPFLADDGLLGGYSYLDAQADDARLVLRVIQEAIINGGTALNYAQVKGFLRSRSGQVCGVVAQDKVPESEGRSIEINASIVVNATGAWADDLRGKISKSPRIRKLRGSHLIFPRDRLPLTQAISVLHPNDRRPVFSFPWEGVSVVGTTDADYKEPMETDVPINEYEVAYLLKATQTTFPDQHINENDIQASLTGIRAVIDTGKENPSKESREHVLWLEDGLLTVTGGKLTTFRLMAHETLKKASKFLSKNITLSKNYPILTRTKFDESNFKDLSPEILTRLTGRYGDLASNVIECAGQGELNRISNTPTIWAELRYAARTESVIHLDDLLLRRVRLGLLLPEGGRAEFNRIREIIQPELNWNNKRWEDELQRYQVLWRANYHPN